MSSEPFRQLSLYESDSANAVVNAGMTDVDADGNVKGKAKKEWVNVPWEVTQARINAAILNGTHSLERKFYCVMCDQWVDNLFHLDIFSSPRKMICRKCAAKFGVKGATDKIATGEDVAIVDHASQPLPPGISRAEEIGLPPDDEHTPSDV